jgi:hypothetical protein
VRYENGGYAGCREFAVGIPDCSSHIGWESRHRSVMISGRRLYADRHVDDAQCRTGLILLELFELAEIGSVQATRDQSLRDILGGLKTRPSRLLGVVSKRWRPTSGRDPGCVPKL